MNRGCFDIAVITDREAFQAILDEWNQLADINGYYTPWFCWEWFDLCLRHGETGALHILMVRSGGSLVAVAPFTVRSERYKGVVPARILSSIGGNRSPLKGIVFGDADENMQREVTTLVLEYLRTTFKNWDILELEPVAGSNDGNSIETLIERQGLSFRSYISCANRYCDVADASFDGFFERLPQSTRKDINYCRRRLEKNGSLVFQIITDAASLDQCLDVYDAVRAKSWKAAEKDREFNRELMHVAAGKGWLRLGILSYDGTPIAVQKWIVANGRAYIYDVLYDEEYKKHSPGKILTSMMFQHAIDNERVAYVDYLRGDEPYKEEWTPSLRNRIGIEAYNKSVLGCTASILMKKILPLVKKNTDSTNAHK
ncbi:Protein involved in cellulose biosynthesis-containing protein (CelD)-like protein [Geobacter metallireducens RCH3]|uniref:GNAT family N-acetyltransferase n=1 Tax=Geobacter metallireducens TaxID=28232 RepID=UPI00024A521C|nr:GNAT family N-acetyltransferase [Geobacter metallireducens]EHP86985.1 Protein involved in cellulose biosynthesis-containing protein (CelD)-like protein [Geobacter metallireducens RCH3]